MCGKDARVECSDAHPHSDKVSMQQQGRNLAWVGLRAKTARAIAIVISGSAQCPHAVTRAEITLATAATPTLFGPYHEVMDLSWDEAVVAVQHSQRAIEEIAILRLKELIRDLRRQNVDVAGIAVVGAPERKLQAIGSPHIRAHAAEGVLFRHVWEAAADAIGMPCDAFPEKDFEALAALRLHLPLEAVRERLGEIGRALGRPWRSDEKAASMAAWLALAGHGSRKFVVNC
jgi:hypothetical protein